MKKNILTKFNNSIFITKDMLRTISNDSEETISKNILRWIKSGDLIKLKNGLYISKYLYNKYTSDSKFTNLIANKLRTPSYISLEYVLSLHNILTEAIYPITSVTLKTGRKFENKTGTYIYKSIKKSLFKGYIIESFLLNNYYIATKEKALFDYLYFKSNSIPSNLKDINLVKDLRLKLDSFTQEDLEMVRAFSKSSRNQKTINIIENIITHASDRI